jgi:hypothetical protein
MKYNEKEIYFLKEIEVDFEMVYANTLARSFILLIRGLDSQVWALVWLPHSLLFAGTVRHIRKEVNNNNLTIHC